MIVFIINAIKIIFLLGFLIFIHEGGHFIVAKLCKVKVNEFAIGFGPTIWRKNGKETKYALRLIPLGGFVSMEGEEQRSEEKGSFSKASLPKRIAIVLAGGIVNIIFGLVIYFALVSINSTNITTIVENVKSGYSAEKYGIITGDQIIKINNNKIRRKAELNEELNKTDGKETNVTIIRDGEQKEIKLIPSSIKSKDVGIYFNAKDDSTEPIISAIYPSSPAEKQGLQIKDIVKKIDGIDVENNIYKVVELINSSVDKEIIFTVQRDEKQIEIEIIPDTVYTYLLGIELKQADKTFINNIYYGFLDTKDFAFSIVDNLKMLFSGKVTTNQLMGPVGISEVVADTQGISDYIYMIALVSLSLGVTNLLPFPPLDGGKIIILLIEAIRRKPLKENIEIGIQMAGFILLIGLSIYVTYNDILRIF